MKYKKMNVLMPDYYTKYHCLADKCKFTCCQQWNISLTRNDYNQLRNLRTTKEMANTLKTGIKRNRPCVSDKNYAHIQLDENKYCPLFTEERLCGLQQKCGYDFLPDTCKEFPTHEFSTPTGVQHSCYSGCEVVVNLLIQNPDPIRFITQEDELFSIYVGNYTNVLKEHPIFNYYDDIQKICIGILQNRNYTFQNRMVLLGLALKDLDALEKEFDVDLMQQWIQTKSLYLRDDTSMLNALNQIHVEPWKALSSSIYHCRLLLNGYQHYSEVFTKSFENLHILLENQDEQFTFDTEVFNNKKKMLLEHFPTFENMLENIMVNMFFTLHYPTIHFAIWNNYKLFCFYYNLIYFICIGYMDGDYKMNDLIYVFTICSRMTLHSSEATQDSILNLFKSTNVDSLADMITLIYN